MAKLYYTKKGDGFPIFIFHGLYGSSDNWMNIAKVLAKHFTVYSVDLRNHGKSEHSSSHSYNEMVEDIVNLLSNLNINKAHLLGHSMGGKVAMLLTLLYPQLVKRLVVVDISPKSYSEFNTNITQHQTILQTLNSININKISSRNEANTIMKHYIKNTPLRQFLLKNLKRNKDNTFSWKININSIINNFENIMSGFENIKIPNLPVSTETIFLKGELSDYISPQEDTPFINTLFSNIRIITIPDAGHWLHAEKQKEFIDYTLKFLLE